MATDPQLKGEFDALAEDKVNDTGDTMTGPLIVPAGTAAAPGLGVGAASTGLFSGGASRLGITTGGVQAVEVDSSQLVGIGTFTGLTAQLQVTSLNAARVGLLVKQASGQTANTLEVRDSANTLLVAVGTNGRMGIHKTAVSTTAILSMTGERVDTTSNAVGTDILISNAGVAGVGGNVIANRFIAEQRAPGGGVNATGCLSSLRVNSTTAVVALGVNFSANSPAIFNGQFTTVYGLRVLAQKVTGVTGNGYGISLDGANDVNYIAGTLGIGVNPAANGSKLDVAGPGRFGVYTVATLPAPSRGQLAFVSDALGPAFGAAVVGGGAVNTPVYATNAGWFVG